MSLLSHVRRYVAAFLVGGMGVAGLASTSAYAASAITTNSASQASSLVGDKTTQPLCPAPARIVYQFVDSDTSGRGSTEHVISTQAFLPSQSVQPVEPAHPHRANQHFLGWQYLKHDGTPSGEQFDPDHLKTDKYAVHADGDTQVKVAAIYDNTRQVVFHYEDEIVGALRVPLGEPVIKSVNGDVVRAAPRIKSPASDEFLAGWAEGSPQGKIRDLTKPVNSRLDLYAVYHKGSIVNFDSDGGASISQIILPSGKSLDPDSLPQSQKAGYQFLYWSLTPHGTEFKSSQTPSHSFTLHAVYKPVLVPVTYVFMREETTGGTYVIDSISHGKQLTGHVIDPTPAVDQKENSEGGIKEEVAVDNSGEKEKFHFIYNRRKTAEKSTIVRGDGTSVKYIYYDRPRSTLTITGNLDYIGNSTASYFKGDPGLFVKKYPNVIAGSSTDSYIKDFRKAFADAIAKSPYKSTWASSMVTDNEGKEVYTYNLTNRSQFYASPPTAYTFAPKMLGHDFNLYTRDVQTNAEEVSIKYVEISQDGRLSQYTDTSIPNTKRVTGKVLSTDLRPEEKFYYNPYGIRLTSEDYVPIKGMTVLNKADTFPYERSNKTLEFWVVYHRNRYSLHFDYNIPDKDDSKFSVLYQHSIKNYVPSDYVKGETTDDAGRIFDGWYDNPSFLGDPIDTTHGTMPAHDLVFYAKWVQPKVKVRYHEWDLKHPTSTAVRSTDTYDKGTRLAVLEQPDTPEGYSQDEFLGWYYLGSQGHRIPIKAGTILRHDYDLYPDWPRKAVEVVYHHGAGTGSVPDTSSLKYYPTHDGIILPAPNLVPPAHKILRGWRVRGGTDTIYKTGDVFPVFPLDASDGNVHLDPVFGPAPAKAQLVYDPNGATAEPISKLYDANSKVDVASATTFTRPGYIFLGWSLTSHGEPFGCQAGQPIVLPEGTSRLYALWKLSSVTITIRKVDENGQLLPGAQFSLGTDPNSSRSTTPLDKKTGGAIFTSSSVHPQTDYYLWETKAPIGHELMPVPIGLRIENGAIEILKPDANPNVTASGLTLTVGNVPAGHLPASGGPGHMPYYLIGIMLVFASVILVLKQKKTTTMSTSFAILPYRQKEKKNV